MRKKGCGCKGIQISLFSSSATTSLFLSLHLRHYFFHILSMAYTPFPFILFIFLSGFIQVSTHHHRIILISVQHSIALTKCRLMRVKCYHIQLQCHLFHSHQVFIHLESYSSDHNFVPVFFLLLSFHFVLLCKDASDLSFSPSFSLRSLKSMLLQSHKFGTRTTRSIHSFAF